MHGARRTHVLTHGFTVDEQGRKMSKSLGNVVAPQKVMKTLGADVLRLWVAPPTTRNEMTVSRRDPEAHADSYRRIRNTARFLLGNLHGFDPAQRSRAGGETGALDRWDRRARARQLQDEIVAAYARYEFHLIYQKCTTSASWTWGGFYLDIIKDRLYTMPAEEPARRSAQTAMYHIAEAMVRWLAPILSFTAEEIWGHDAGRARRSRAVRDEWYAGSPAAGRRQRLADDPT
jgi:isoleucyl-tRNA synthetase